MAFVFKKYSFGGIGEDLDAELTEQEALISELKGKLANGGGGGSGGGAKIKPLTATENGTYDATVSGLGVETITVDDTFPTYTSDILPGMVFAKLSDIVLDNIEDYINADYSVKIVGLAEIPFSHLVYMDAYKAYAFDVVYVSNNDSELGFGTTGVFAVVEMDGTSYQVSATIPRVIESADGYNPVVVSLPFETAATNGVKAHGANDESSFYVLTNDNRIFLLGSGAFTKTLAFYQVNAVSAYIGEGITLIGVAAFAACGISELVLPSTVQELQLNSFMANTNLKTVTFKGKPTNVHADAFNHCTAITDIYVPWAEGEVANAPWGATNATIHYNHTAETTA